MLENLKSGEVKSKSVGEFLLELKKEFGRGDKESVKIAELKRIEQGGRTMKEFIQEFWRTARDNWYEERVLVEEFKREMNGTIKRNLMEVEMPSINIEQ